VPVEDGWGFAEACVEAEMHAIGARLYGQAQQQLLQRL
jgi:hypothetical protein